MNDLNKIRYLSAVIAGLSFGSIPVISAILRNLGVSSIEQTFIRILLGSIFGFIVILFYFFKKRVTFKETSSRKLQLIYLLQGLIFVLMILSYLSSVALNTPVGEAALLVQMHPFITLLAGWKLLNEELTARKVLAIFIAISGIIILTRPWSWQQFLTHIVGDLFALANGVLYAIYLLIGRSSSEKRKNVPYILSISFVLFWSIIIAIPLLFCLSFLPLPNSLSTFSFTILVNPGIIGIGIIFAVFGSIIPYGLIMVALKKIESSKASILLLGEPVSAIILGFLILSQSITIWYLIGGSLIMCAVIIIVLSRSKT
ncbi:MAG: DMT family transporter [Candidatus Lokiarchaeota archaeon]